MKKTYVAIDWEITSLAVEDVIATSGKVSFDPNGMLNNPTNDRWEW